MPHPYTVLRPRIGIETPLIVLKKSHIVSDDDPPTAGVPRPTITSWVSLTPAAQLSYSTGLGAVVFHVKPEPTTSKSTCASRVRYCSQALPRSSLSLDGRRYR